MYSIFLKNEDNLNTKGKCLGKRGESQWILLSTKSFLARTFPNALHKFLSNNNVFNTNKECYKLKEIKEGLKI